MTWAVANQSCSQSALIAICLLNSTSFNYSQFLKLNQTQSWFLLYPSTCIHYGMSQEERLKRYQDFKEGKKRILVATDLVGRRIDIERINIVINYDISDPVDSYLHRVGRAGMFGTKGLAITFIATSDDSKALENVQKRFEVDIKHLPEQIDTSIYMMA